MIMDNYKKKIISELFKNQINYETVLDELKEYNEKKYNMYFLTERFNKISRPTEQSIKQFINTYEGAGACTNEVIEMVIWFNLVSDFGAVTDCYF